MQLYGMGEPPEPPPRPRARMKSDHTLVVTWRPAEVEATPHIHKYRLQRRDDPWGAWLTIYDGPALSLVDEVEAKV
jgi:hypothetical protein